jgi:hypothetical protein
VAELPEGSTWTAPGAAALVVGAVLVVGSLIAGLPSWLTVIGVAAGGLLIALFVVRYAWAALRGEIPERDDGGPPGGWSSTGGGM